MKNLSQMMKQAQEMQERMQAMQERLAERAGGRWRASTVEGGRFEADRVIVATEAHATARLVRYLDPTLATLLGGGIPLVNAIEVAGRSISNRYIARELQRAGQQVREGRALSAAMNDRGAFADVAVKMVEVGESTGALQEMLNSLADFYDEEIDTNLGRFITLVEPILLVIMGIVIAGLLLSLYMPLFSMSGLNQ